MRPALETGPPAKSCPWSDCWCKAWPPQRVVASTGERYTMVEVEPGLFSYHYPDAAARVDLEPRA